ncbi:MAG: hypothetical protein ABWY52_05995 [Candidatus Limnocylindrales bacterium]
MKTFVSLALIALVLAACSSASSPSAAPSVTTAPSVEPTAPPTDAVASPSAEPTAVPSFTLTPAAPDPGVSMAATWWLDPAGLPIDPGSTVLRGFVVERACASGQSPEGRILAPDVDYGAEALTITFSIAPLPGDQDCPGNQPFGVVFELDEPVGERPIFDGSTTPARDATIPGS